MPLVPMSIFVDFALANGTPRVTLVTNWKREEHDNHDFYRGLKSAIVGMHTKGETVDSLRSFVESQKDARRKRIYPELLGHYGECMKRLHLMVSSGGAPPRLNKRMPLAGSFWGAYKVGVSVDPQVSFVAGDLIYLVKLYLRSEAPTKKRVDLTLELMRVAYEATGQPILSRPPPRRYALLDVRRRKLHVAEAGRATPLANALWTLLHGELAAFNAIYWRV